MSNTKVILDDFRVRDILEHHGVKGMHWGFRNSVRKDAKAKERFVKTVSNSASAIYNDATGAMNHHVSHQISNKPEFKGKDLTKPGMLQNKYHRDVAQAFAGELDKAYAKHVGQFQTDGVFKAHFLVEPKTNVPYLMIYKKIATHAAEDGERFDVTMDDMGHITELTYTGSPVLMQSSVNLDVFLEHHGIKGMHWGFRNKITSRPPRNLSADHKEAAVLKKKSASQLSNKELQTINNRLNLEQNYNRMTPSKLNTGHKHVKSFLATVGTGVTAYSLFHSPAGKAARKAALEFIARMPRTMATVAKTSQMTLF